MSLESALLVDALVVLAAALALALDGRVRASHPGVIYLAFHVLVFSFRGWGLRFGGAPFMDIGYEAVAQAIVMADVFLACACAGWLLIPRRPVGLSRSPQIQLATINNTAAIAIPIGAIALVLTGYVPGVQLAGATVETSYQNFSITWPALALLAFIYARGLKPKYLVPLLGILLVLSLQGHSRFRVVLPLLMLLLVYLDQRGRKWPPVSLVAVGLIGLVLFFPLKEIGLAVRSGDASLSSVTGQVVRSTETAARGSNSEQAILDQLAITRSLTDDREAVLLGRPYLPLLYLPVPRPLWPGKPSLAEGISEISSIRFPLDRVGGVTTLVGELYLNFRWPGVTLGGLAFAQLTGRFFRRSRAAPRMSAIRFLYVVFAVAIVQVARDGLGAFVLFTIVNATPWVWIGLMAYVSRGSTASRDLELTRNAR